jgi:putative membrane protein
MNTEHNENHCNPAGSQPSRGKFLFAMLKGALIGVGAILPGISGGVLCVVLGIYRPLMELMAHPLREMKKNFLYFLPILLGLALGVLGISKLLQWVLDTFETPAVWLFVGLIAGTLPSMWKEAGKNGRKRGDMITGIVTFALMLAFLLFIRISGSIAGVQPTVWLWAACGVLWGLGIIAPGLAPSSLFFFLGVMEPMMAGISGLSMQVILPMAAGLMLCVLTLSRGIGWLLNNRFSATMHALFGLTLASTIAILPLGGPVSFTGVLGYFLCFCAGVAVALWMDRMNQRLVAKGQKS